MQVLEKKQVFRQQAGPRTDRLLLRRKGIWEDDSVFLWAEEGLCLSRMEIFTFLDHYGFPPLSEGLGARPKPFLDKATEARRWWRGLPLYVLCVQLLRVSPGMIVPQTCRRPSFDVESSRRHHLHLAPKLRTKGDIKLFLNHIMFFFFISIEFDSYWY